MEAIESQNYKCGVFSAEEIRIFKGLPRLINYILGLFITIIVLIFVPFAIITHLSMQVGSLTSVMEEREKRVQTDQLRIEKLENKFEKFQDKFYWVNRNSREANEGIKKLGKNIDTFLKRRFVNE